MLPPAAAHALPTPPLPGAATTVVPPVPTLPPAAVHALPTPRLAPPVVPPAVHFDSSTSSLHQHGQPSSAWTSHPTLSISDHYMSLPTSGYPYCTSNPMVIVNPLSILFSFLSSCSGLLNSDGTISYVLLHVVLAGKCSPNQSAFSANFGSTLKLDYLNTLVEALSPNLSSRSPQSLEDAVNIISEVSAGLRMPLVIRDTDLISPEPGVCDSGLSTLLTLGIGKASTQKFWIASCLVGGAGLLVDRSHSSNDALRYLDQDTFSRLIPEYARELTDVNLATLMLV